MNILDKMQLLKLLREYKKTYFLSPPDGSRTLTPDGLTTKAAVETVSEDVEGKIRNWLNSGGGF